MNAPRLAAKYASITVAGLESLLFGSGGPEYPPVFVIGPPRSGSTLLFQAMCHTFKCSYPASLLRYLWPCPAFGTWTLTLSGRGYNSDFTSRYGLGSGLSSPYSLNTMNLMFGRSGYPEPEEIDDLPARYVVGTLGRIERIMEAPFISKNQRYNQWVKVLAALFPDCVFLVALRDPYGVALSLLRARQEVHGDFEAWYLEKPRTYPLPAGSPPEEQVAGQVWGIIEDIRMDMEVIGSERFAVLHYEDLCEDPAGLLGGLQTFLEGKGVPLQQRQELPENFRAVAARTEGLEEGQVQRVREAVADFFPSGSMSGLSCPEIRSTGRRSPNGGGL